MRKNFALASMTAILLVLSWPLSAQLAPIEDPIEIGLASHLGPCSAHAELTFEACGLDVRDDFLVHLADCAYTVEPAKQRRCIGEARWFRGEGFKECEDIYEARLELCELVGEQRYTPAIDPDDFVDPNDIGDSVAPNPYWPLTAGHTAVIVGEGEVTVVTNTEEVVDIGGLPCRVVIDIVFGEEDDEEDDEEGGEDQVIGAPSPAISYEPAEVTRDWYGQHINGDVYYCGENTYEIEDGLIDNTDGSFAHLTERALAGVLVRAFPVPGEGDRQEMATDEAEDFVRYESLTATPSDEEGGDSAIPCAGGCLKTFEQNPRDPGETEFKYYVPGTGFVLATKFEDGEPTGEREEVSCIGDSLDILDDPACGIADPDALREELCVWSLGDLCAEEDE